MYLQRVWICHRRAQLMVSYVYSTIRGGSPRSEYRAPCFQCGNCIIGHDICHCNGPVISSESCCPSLCTCLSLPVSVDADMFLILCSLPSPFVSCLIKYPLPIPLLHPLLSNPLLSHHLPCLLRTSPLFLPRTLLRAMTLSRGTAHSRLLL